MYIINGNNEVFEINDSSSIHSFVNLGPEESLVVDEFENGIKLDDIVELCIYDGKLTISNSKDNLSDLNIVSQKASSIAHFTVSVKNRLEQLGVYLGWKDITMLHKGIMYMKNLSNLRLLNLAIALLPESIGNLSSLSLLDLRGTSLTTLPESIGNLSSLSLLDLSATKLTTLPESIGNLSSLSLLDLSATKLTTLPESIGNLSSLSLLDLTATNISTLSESIGNMTGLSSMNLRVSRLTTLPESIGNLTRLSNLDLMGTGLTTLPESIGNLSSLRSLNLSGTKLTTLPESIGNLSSLSSLGLSGTKLTALPESIGNLTSLSFIYLNGTGLNTLPESIGNLACLSSLNLSGIKLTTLPESIGNLANLSSLDLSGTRLTTLPEGIENLTSLRSLNLSGTELTTLPESIGNLTSLRSLNLSGTGLTTLPESIGNLSSLYLSGTGLTTLPESIGNLSNLSSLDLSSTRLTTLPESIGNLISLSSLDLNGTGFTSLPQSIGNYKSLKHLNLHGMSLYSIDKSIVELNLEFCEKGYFFSSSKGINILELSLETQPVSLFLQPRPLIEEYFASEMVPVNTIKCIILGYGNAGKTYTLSRLLKGGAKGNYATKETPGVEIRSYETKKKSGAYTINFWDFGGQEIMYSMHRCFLTERSCYLIVVDNRRADMDMMAQARFWLKNIATFVHGAPVIIMANMWEKDKYRDDIEIKRLREEFGKAVDLKCVIPISAKTASKKQFKAELIDRIEELAESMVSHDMEFPVKWSRIRSELHKMGQDHSNYYISQEEYYSICQKNGVENRDIQNWLLDWFNDLGDCFSYYKSNKGISTDLIGEYKVLDPRWITNAIYILITRGYGFIDHQRSPGILTKTAIEMILKNAEGGVIKYIKKYEKFECSYIMRVMEKFELAYDVARDGEKYFIPALLTKREPENKRPENYRQLVKYVLEYDFLPSNTLHKLMVRFYNELELSKCWDKGMVLRNVAIDQWVLLDMGGGDDRLYIEVYACGRDPACKMLNLTLNRLQVVNESLSLKPVHYIITPDEYKQEIEVEDLLELKNGPRKRNVYQGKKVDYNIDELLGYTFGDVAKYVNGSIEGRNGGEAATGSYTHNLLGAIQKLVEDKDFSLILTRKNASEMTTEDDGENQIQSLLGALTKALVELQKNRHYYDAKENDCNTFVRALLTTAGYVCKDQTLQGVSASRQGDGELDILIQDKERMDDIAIYEALKLTQKTFGKSDQQYLADHLRKLLDNYNPTGHKDLLLVSYVSWDKNRFNGLSIKYKDYVLNTDTAPYKTIENSLEELINKSFLRCYKVGYDCGGITMYVYHFIVRVAE